MLLSFKLIPNVIHCFKRVAKAFIKIPMIEVYCETVCMQSLEMKIVVSSKLSLLKSVYISMINYVIDMYKWNVLCMFEWCSHSMSLITSTFTAKCNKLHIYSKYVMEWYLASVLVTGFSFQF